MFDIFISYPRAERAKAEPVKEKLEALGFSVFFDIEGIDGGAEFPDVIDQALCNSKAVLACWSPLYFTRRWCLIEARFAASRQPSLLVPIARAPIGADDAPADFLGVNYFDLADWAGEDAHEDWARMLKTLAKLVGRDPRSAPAAGPATPDPGARDAAAHKLADLEETWRVVAAGAEEAWVARFHERVQKLAPGSDLAARIAGRLAELARERAAAKAQAAAWAAGAPARRQAELREIWRREATGADEAWVAQFLAAAQEAEAPGLELEVERHLDGLRRAREARNEAVRRGGKRLLTLDHGRAVTSAGFSPDGTRIVTASHDKTAIVWDAARGQKLLTLSGHGDWVRSAAFSPDGRRIVTASRDKTAIVWDAARGQKLLTLTGHGGYVYSAAFSPDGARIVTASSDQTARIWDAASGRALRTLNGHGGEVNSAAFSPDGTRIVTASSDQTARIWEAASGALLLTLSGHGRWVNSAAFSPDGTRIVTASWDKTARIWDAARGEVLLTLSGHGGWVRSAAFSPDGARIVTASLDQTAIVWDAASGALLRTLSGHGDYVTSAAFSPDGTRIVTASDDKTAIVWAVEG